MEHPEVGLKDSVRYRRALAQSGWHYCQSLIAMLVKLAQAEGKKTEWALETRTSERRLLLIVVSIS
jgi:hypothetical protein